MIKIIPSRGPLRIGVKVYISAPTEHMKKPFVDFITRNESYHKPWIYHAFDPKYYAHYLKRIKRGVTQGCFVFENESDKLVGVININNILLGSIRSASLGYSGDQDVTGSGYMLEAMNLVLSYAFMELGLHRIEANIQPENIPSLKLVNKMGFRKEGYSPKYLQIGGKWCDHERWAILEEEFLSQSLEM